MTNNKQPLIRFDNFATALERHGIHVGEAKDAYREMKYHRKKLRSARFVRAAWSLRTTASL